MTIFERTRPSGLRIRLAGGALALAAAMMTAVPALATHEVTVGHTFYSDGTTAKTAAVGSTLTVNATGVPLGPSCSSGRGVCGVDGGLVEGPVIDYWLITVGKHYLQDGKDIPCYDGFQYVDNVPRHAQANGTIPNASFTVPSGLTPGQWEVCFYAQPLNYVTAAAHLMVP